MKARIWIPGPLPAMNEILRVKGGRYSGAWNNLKKRWQTTVWACVMASGARPFQGPVRLSFEWVEKDSRRDPDNVMAAQKLVLDAFVNGGLLVDDSQKVIRPPLIHRWRVDKNNPGVMVEIESEAA